MAIFGRMAAGIGQGAAQMASKYIDEEIATNRAAFLADLQRTTAGQIREDEDKFQNDPTRVERNRQRRADDLKSEGATRRGIELETLNDTGLQGAKARNADVEADAEIKRKLKAGEALLPYEVERAGKLAQAQAKAQAMYREPKEPKPPKGLFERMDEADKVAYQGLAAQSKSINDAITKAQAEDTWRPDAAGAKDLLKRQAAINIQMRHVLEKYSDKPAGQNTDPLGLFKDSPPSPKPEAKPEAKPDAANPAAVKQPAGPGIMDKLSQAVGGWMDEGAKTGAQIEALRAKVKSGAPLTKEETALARKFGMGA